MKTVTGRVTSSKPISLSVAATLLSSFVSSETQASQDVAAYLRRASAAFTELKSFHREVRSTKAKDERNPSDEVVDVKKKRREEEDGVEEKGAEKLKEENKERKKKKNKGEDFVDEKVNVIVKLEEEERKEKKKKNKGEDVVEEKVNEKRKEKKRKSDGEIGSEERKSKKKKKRSKEQLDA